MVYQDRSAMNFLNAACGLAPALLSRKRQSRTILTIRLKSPDRPGNTFNRGRDHDQKRDSMARQHSPSFVNGGRSARERSAKPALLPRQREGNSVGPVDRALCLLFVLGR